MFNKKKILTIIVLSVLVILMGIPALHLGYVRISSDFTLTLMHIPVILAALLEGISGGLITGLVFGVTSLINAACNPGGSLDSMLRNPLCSVLPSLIFGASVYGFYKLFGLWEKVPDLVKSSAAAFFASLLHSFVVIGSMYIFIHSYAVRALRGLSYLEVMKLILPKSIWESITAAIVVVIVFVIKKYKGQKED